MNVSSHILRHLSPAARYRMADVLSGPVALLWKERRPVIEQNCATVLGVSAGDPRVRALASACVRNFGRMAMDFLAVRTMSDEEVLAWVTPVGERYLDEAMRGGRGVIMALPHVGSWDVAAVFAQAYGCRLTVVTQDDWLAELVAGSRMGRGVTLAPRNGSLRVLFRALKRNECVVMLCDIAPPGVPAIAVPFFGRPALFPVGPARLAQRTGAPIMVVGSVRTPNRTYRVEAQPLLRANPALPDGEAIEQLTAAIAAGFERFIASYPTQWYPFHPIWPPNEPAAATSTHCGDRPAG